MPRHSGHTAHWGAPRSAQSTNAKKVFYSWRRRWKVSRGTWPGDRPITFRPWWCGAWVLIHKARRGIPRISTGTTRGPTRMWQPGGRTRCVLEGEGELLCSGDACQMRRRRKGRWAGETRGLGARCRRLIDPFLSRLPKFNLVVALRTPGLR